MYVVLKINCKTDEETYIATDLTFEKACSLIHGFKKTEEYKTSLSHQVIFERKNSQVIYVVRKFN